MWIFQWWYTHLLTTTLNQSSLVRCDLCRVWNILITLIHRNRASQLQFTSPWNLCIFSSTLIVSSWILWKSCSCFLWTLGRNQRFGRGRKLCSSYFHIACKIFNKIAGCRIPQRFTVSTTNETELAYSWHHYQWRRKAKYHPRFNRLQLLCTSPVAGGSDFAQK